MALTLSQFDAIATTTIQTYVETTLRDNIFQSDPLFAYMFYKGAMKKSGGDKLKVPLLYGQSEAGGPFNGYDLLDNTPSEGMGFAYFDWKEYYETVVISQRERVTNKGKAAIIDLLEGKIKQAEMTLRDRLKDGLYSDGTGTTSKQLTGLKAVLDATGTYGGIDRSDSDYSFWKPQLDSTDEAISKSNVRSMIHSIHGAGPSNTKGNAANKDQRGVCDLIIMTSTLFEAFEDLFVAQARYEASDPTRAQELGLSDVLRYKGADITWSDDMPSEEAWFLSTEYMDLVTHEDLDFDTAPFQTPTNQAASVSHIFWMGELTASNCRRLGKMTTKSAS